MRSGAETYTLRGEGGQVLSEFGWTAGESLESFANPAWDVDYFYGAGRLVAQDTAEGRTYVATDYLGSTRALLTEKGGALTLEQTFVYYPFGELIQPPSPSSPHTDHLFTGHERDHETTGLDYMHARFYSNQLGRFLSVDPVGGDIGSSQSWNRYSYVSNNPLGLIDPDGCAPAGALQEQAIRSEMTPEQVEQFNQIQADVEPKLVGGGLAVGAAVALAAVAAPEVAAVATSVALNPRTQQVAQLAAEILDPGPGGMSNPVPSRLARAIPGEGSFPTLGHPGRADVFVTAAGDIAGLDASGISRRLTVPDSSSFTVVEFSTPSTGLASPVFRTDPGFVGGGRTAGGAREFVIPNGPIPPDSTTKVVH